MSADMTESLQIENQKIEEQNSVKEIIDTISKFKKEKKMRNRKQDIEDYRYLADKFKQYQHLD